MICALPNVALRAFRVAPVGTVDLAPPFRALDCARRLKVLGQKHREDERPAELLGLGCVIGFCDELRELIVGHGCRGDCERAQRDLVRRRFAILRVSVAARVAHLEAAAIKLEPFEGGAAHAALACSAQSE